MALLVRQQECSWQDALGCKQRLLAATAGNWQQLGDTRVVASTTGTSLANYCSTRVVALPGLLRVSMGVAHRCRLGLARPGTTTSLVTGLRAREHMGWTLPASTAGATLHCDRHKLAQAATHTRLLSHLLHAGDHALLRKGKPSDLLRTTLST